jgi:hypothetical protein
MKGYNVYTRRINSENTEHIKKVLYLPDGEFGKLCMATVRNHVWSIFTINNPDWVVSAEGLTSDENFWNAIIHSKSEAIRIYVEDGYVPEIQVSAEEETDGEDILFITNAPINEYWKGDCYVEEYDRIPDDLDPDDYVGKSISDLCGSEEMSTEEIKQHITEAINRLKGIENTVGDVLNEVLESEDVEAGDEPKTYDEDQVTDIMKFSAGSGFLVGVTLTLAVGSVTRGLLKLLGKN